MIPEPYVHRSLQTRGPDELQATRDYWPRIKFTAVDTNVLLKNISRDVRDWPQPTRMRSLAAGGMYRLFAADHVFGEVEEHLDRVIADLGRDVALARMIWAREYLPRIRFVSVDAAALVPLDPRIAAVIDHDPDDAPTAALAILLGMKVLSEDTDLLEPGLASGPPWLEMIIALENAKVGDTANFRLALTTSVTFNAIGALTRRVSAIGATQSGRLALLFCAVVICALAVCLARSEQGRGRTKVALRSTWQHTAPVLDLAIRAYSQAAQNRSLGVARLAQAALSAPQGLQELALATRLLAGASAPMSSKELAREMWGYVRVPQRADDHVEALLRSSEMFIERRSIGWQLGRPLGHSQVGRSPARLPWP